MSPIFRASLNPLEAYFIDQLWVLLHLEVYNHKLAHLLGRHSYYEIFDAEGIKISKQKKIDQDWRYTKPAVTSLCEVTFLLFISITERNVNILFVRKYVVNYCPRKNTRNPYRIWLVYTGNWCLLCGNFPIRSIQNDRHPLPTSLIFLQLFLCIPL